MASRGSRRPDSCRGPSPSALSSSAEWMLATRRRRLPPCSCTFISPGLVRFSVPASGWSPQNVSIRGPRRKSSGRSPEAEPSAACSVACWPSASPSCSTSAPCCPCWRFSISYAPGRSAAWPPTSPAQSEEFSPELTPESAWSGVRVLAETPYLRHLALLVLLGTTSAALIDYVFKVQAVAALRNGRESPAILCHLLRRDEPRHRCRADLDRPIGVERLGLAFTSATPSIALFAGGLGALVAPGLRKRALWRGRGIGVPQLVVPVGLRGVLHADTGRRKARREIDHRRWLRPHGRRRWRRRHPLHPAACAGACSTPRSSRLTLVCSAAAMVVASRLNRGYVLTLERNLRDRALELDLSDVRRSDDANTIDAQHGVEIATRRRSSGRWADGPRPRRNPQHCESSGAVDPDIQAIMSLRSRDRDRVARRASPERRPQGRADSARHPVARLGSRGRRRDPCAAQSGSEARRAPSADALLDPYEDFAVRRRIPRVMAVCRTQRAVDSLLLGLEDIRFEVRFQCGRSLAAIAAKQPDLRIDAARVFDVVLKEVAVGRPVWEGRHLLDRLEDGESGPLVDDFIKSRASQSLAHVFTMLSLVLPAEPLQIALRGLYVDDQNLRGTALEYLESVLPPIDSRSALAVSRGSPSGRQNRRAPGKKILADLVRSNHSIMLNLEELNSTSRRTEMTAMADTKATHRSARTDACTPDGRRRPMARAPSQRSDHRAGPTACAVQPHRQWCSGRPAW